MASLPLPVEMKVVSENTVILPDSNHENSGSNMQAAVEIMVPKSLSLTEQNHVSTSSMSSSSIEIVKNPQDSSFTNETTTVLPVHQEDGTYPELHTITTTTTSTSICDMDVIICAAIAVFVAVQYCDVARNCR